MPGGHAAIDIERGLAFQGATCIREKAAHPVAPGGRLQPAGLELKALCHDAGCAIERAEIERHVGRGDRRGGFRRRDRTGERHNALGEVCGEFARERLVERILARVAHFHPGSRGTALEAAIGEIGLEIGFSEAQIGRDNASGEFGPAKFRRQMGRLAALEREGR